MWLSKEQVEELVFDEPIETIQGEDRRWSRTNETIVLIEDKYYSLEWECGLTEGQEDTFEDQEAPEVMEISEMVLVKSWVDVKWVELKETEK